MSGHLFSRVCIVGVGLIGGSLARAAREKGLFGEVVGCSRNAGHLQRGVELGVIDRYSTDLAEAVAGADLVVIATPLGAIRRVLEGIAGHLAEGTLVTDVGSAKGSVLRDAREVFGDLPPTFVPGHPIAGTENSGVEASFPELFRERRVILTPVEETDPAATARVRALWEGVGAEVVEMSVEHHDEVLAATSHLPHVVAFSLVDTLARLNDRVEIFRYAAGGFRDFTRIASSDPVMWRDICLANREALLKILDDFRADLDHVRSAIERSDGEWLRDTFAAAKRARDDYSA